MLCHVLLSFTIHCITERISFYPMCHARRLLSPLSPFQFNTTTKSNLSPIYYQKTKHERKCSKETNNSEYALSKTKDKFHTHSLREKCPYLEFFWSVFSRIRIEYGPEKLQKRTLFTQ